MAFLMVFCILFSGCEKPLSDVPPVSKRRTVLVYLGTDNNFRREAFEKIETLKNNWSRHIDGNLLIYADTGESAVLVHIYHTARRGNVADTIEIYAPENSASPATLARVLNRVEEYRPAASRGLVVLSHGTGWLPAEMSQPSIGLKAVIQDRSESVDNYMELSDFANAIPNKLDFIIFDACFMGSIEVCYELKDIADYIVASPAEVLAPGFVYATMMQHLFAPVPNLREVAREFYEYFDNLSGNFRSATVSVVKTAELEALAMTVQEILQSNPQTPEINNIQTFGYGAQRIYFDLGDYLQKLSPENQNNIQTALKRCVVYEVHTPQYYSGGTRMLQPIHTFSGLTVYIPQAQYPLANDAYRMLRWTQRIHDSFLP